MNTKLAPIALVLLTASIPFACSEKQQPAAPEATATATETPDVATTETTAPATATQSTPDAALKSMLELAKKGDWKGYVTQHYGEIDKVTDPAQIDQLAEKFATKYGAKLIPVLEQASQATPRIEADEAIYEKDGQMFFKLYLDNGKWGFHL